MCAGGHLRIDNNRYAFQFDEEVFRHFTDYVMNQEAGRLQWEPAGSSTTKSVSSGAASKGQAGGRGRGFHGRASDPKRVEENQLACYLDIEYMNHGQKK